MNLTPRLTLPSLSFSARPVVQRANRLLALGIFALGVTGLVRAAGRPGADLPWLTIEAESMTAKGTVLGPRYDPFLLETESSNQRCVRLGAPGDYVEFHATQPANALVVRYSLPDSSDGTGTHATLELKVNGQRVQSLALTSQRSWLYGVYPFSNRPSDGKPRNFYDEARVKALNIEKGDLVRIEFIPGTAKTAVIDLVDLEWVAPPLTAPPGAISVTDFGAIGNGVADDTEALRKCILVAVKDDRVVWVPAGEYKITGDILLPSTARIQGAGMWHTTFVGDENLYPKADRRVRFKLTGSEIHLADFAIVGKLNYRNDDQPNDGIVGAGCADSSLSRIWIEHTKVGAWIYNGTRIRIEGCRFRNLLADGVNLCVGTNHSTIDNCSARGAGDDGFAIWPAPTDQGFVENAAKAGNNVIRHCTAQLPFLANGAAIYGGDSNRIEDCLFTDITTGCGILISTSFQTSDEARKMDNNFSGMTTVENCRLERCGGYDHTWAWRGSIQLCLERKSISGLTIKNVDIIDSFSDGVTVVAPGSAKGQGTLSNARLENMKVQNPGIGSTQRRAIWIRDDAQGGFILKGSALKPVQNDAKAFAITVE